jgi:hypothetical protein
MRKLILACGLLGLMSASLAAQTTTKSWMLGTWEGTGYQTDVKSTWPMKLTVGRKRNSTPRYSIDYPSLRCGGEWRLLLMGTRTASFRERLSYGQNDCALNGDVVIEEIGKDQLLFLYRNEGERAVTASAILNRIRRKN